MFGKFGKQLQQYADLDGYVPEAGDPASMFEYEEPNDFDDPDVWEDFVQEAMNATDHAEDEMRRSRESRAMLPKLIQVKGYTYRLASSRTKR